MWTLVILLPKEDHKQVAAVTLASFAWSVSDHVSLIKLTQPPLCECNLIDRKMLCGSDFLLTTQVDLYYVNTLFWCALGIVPVLMHWQNKYV